LPVAIGWRDPPQAQAEADLLPIGRLKLSDVVFSNVAAAVDCRVIGALSLEVTNTLHLGPGPLVRFRRCPRRDEPVTLDLARSTLRAAACVLEFQCERLEEAPGEVSVHAAECVLALQGRAALIRVASRTSPDALLRSVSWRGQGAILPETPALAEWQPPDGPARRLDGSEMRIAGLVRGRVEFAGRDLSVPAASRVDRWEAPLLSDNPPGIDDRTLHLPPSAP
jgi:hypothetical protein